MLPLEPRTEPISIQYQTNRVACTYSHLTNDAASQRTRASRASKLSQLRIGENTLHLNTITTRLYYVCPPNVARRMTLKGDGSNIAGSLYYPP
jgi:hypothetical protein